MSKLFALGVGIGYQNANNEWLDTFYPAPKLNPEACIVEAVLSVFPGDGNRAELADAEQLKQLSSALEASDFEFAQTVKSLADSSQQAVVTILAEDEAPSSVPECYLKLHLLSHCLVKPHGINLTGMFGVLPNVAWTNLGAVDMAELPAKQLQARINGELLEVMSVDKFPKMTNYVVPKGVRIAHTARVRLGAYLGEGTTIMHEGFVNFNAGAEGPAMVEGRISAGVFLGAGTDIGGGASTMGTLSGGNNVIISVGEKCLIGANAGVGIPLGDRCTIEAGLYVTAGSVVQLISESGESAGQVKARDLAGKSDLLFRRNSKTGAIEALSNKSVIELNKELH